jgi:hypothetical protein
MVSSTFYFVFTRPKPGQDEAFNDWYSKRHIYDLVAIPGIAAAQRYRLLDAATRAETPDYLAIYEFSDADRAIAGIAERRGTDLMPSTDAIDRDQSKGVVFEPLWDVAADWRFGSGALDLVKLKMPLLPASLQSGPGHLAATQKQSRPGPAVFDLASFATDGRASEAAVGSDEIAARLSAWMTPITDRVA